MSDDDRAERYKAALVELDVAIHKFHMSIDPDEFLRSWALITHKELAPDADMDPDTVLTSVGSHASREVTFVERRGMLEIALQREIQRTSD